MIDLQIELKAERARRTLRTLIGRIKDMSPVWKDFKQYWTDDLMPRSWQSKGALMEGGRWAALSPAYRKWKLSAKNSGSKELLKLSLKLYNAATGGAGWYDDIKKNTMTIGVNVGDYSYWIQHRQKNPRFYFYTPKEDIPNRAYAYLIKIMDEYLESADDER